jgi:hypothetical protein
MSSESRFLIPIRGYRIFTTKQVISNSMQMKRIAQYRLQKFNVDFENIYSIVNQHNINIFNNPTKVIPVHLGCFSWRSSMLSVVFPAVMKRMSWIMGLYNKIIKWDAIALGSTFQSLYPAFRVNKIMKEYVHIQGQAFLGRLSTSPNIEARLYGSTHHNVGLKSTAQPKIQVQALNNNYAFHKYQ